jgi:hypothetical protein
MRRAEHGFWRLRRQRNNREHHAAFLKMQHWHCWLQVPVQQHRIAQQRNNQCNCQLPQYYFFVFRGVLITISVFVVRCESVGNAITVAGNLIGEVTAPTGACPVKTKTLGIKFGVTSGSQNQKTIDGSATEYDLTATTAGGSAVTAALEGTSTNTFKEPSEATIDCNAP